MPPWPGLTMATTFRHDDPRPPTRRIVALLAAADEAPVIATVLDLEVRGELSSRAADELIAALGRYEAAVLRLIERLRDADEAAAPSAN